MWLQPYHKRTPLISTSDPVLLKLEKTASEWRGSRLTRDKNDLKTVYLSSGSVYQPSSHECGGESRDVKLAKTQQARAALDVG
jgi:hypothetical protein